MQEAIATTRLLPLAQERLSVPAAGRSIYKEAERRGAVVRKATRTLWQGTRRRNDAANVIASVFGNGHAAHAHADEGGAELRAAWLLVNVWLYVRANHFGLGDLSFQEAETVFMGDASEQAGPRLSDVFSEQQLQESASCLNGLSVDDDFRDLLPYILDPHGPGSRASVMRDPGTATVRKTRRESGIYFTPEDVAEYMTNHVLGNLAPGRTSCPTVLDPACGTGVFLRVAFRLLAQLGYECNTALGSLFGCDICLQSVETCPFVLLDTYSQQMGGIPDSPVGIWRRIRGNLAVVDSCTLELRGTGRKQDVRGATGRSRIEEGSVAYGASFSLSGVSCNDTTLTYADGLSTQLEDIFPDLVGGVDVLLGNPPYNHLGEREDCAALKERYASLNLDGDISKAEVFLLFVEMMWRLTKGSRSAAALVLPMSIGYHSGRQFQLCRRAMASHGCTWQCAFFDREPHALFGEDVKTRNAIVFFDRDSKATYRGSAASFGTTALTRWTSRSRADLFGSIGFTEGNGLPVEPFIPKLGSEIEVECFRMLGQRLRRLADSHVSFGSRPLADAKETDSSRRVLISGTAYNFINVFRYVIPESSSMDESFSASPAHEILFESEPAAQAGFAVAASRLTYWLWQVEGDGFHVTRRFLQSLPYDFDSFSSDTISQLADLGESVWRECWQRRSRNVNGGKTTFAFRPILESPAISAVDAILIAKLGLPAPFGRRLTEFVHDLVVIEDEQRRHLLK